MDPQETVCEPGAEMPGVQIIEPREVPLGGLRAMDVRRTLPRRERSLIGAWCFLDHYGPDDVAETGGMNVPAHPHIGLQTVSWLFSGEIEHRDSAGFHAMVRPGEMNLMTAGSGISHSERSTAATTILHGTQLWVVLPESARHGEKMFEHYVPEVIAGEGWEVQVFLGELLGDRSPVRSFTPIVGAEIRIQGGGSLTVPVNPAFEHGILVDSGEVRLDSAPIRKDELGYIAPGREALELTAGDDDVRIILIGGEPFPEKIVMWWNFIGRDHDEIVQARADWQKEISAAGAGDPSGATEEEIHSVTPRGNRYGLPDGEPEPPFPAPKLPIARLTPREIP